MDATYGTNSSIADLVAVTTKVDGAGVPIAYIFVEKQGIPHGGRRSVDGAMTSVLTQFVEKLSRFGMKLGFFEPDKDSAEISAVGLVFPNDKHKRDWKGRLYSNYSQEKTIIYLENTQYDSKILPPAVKCQGVVHRYMLDATGLHLSSDRFTSFRTVGFDTKTACLLSHLFHGISAIFSRDFLMIGPGIAFVNPPTRILSLDRC